MGGIPEGPGDIYRGFEYLVAVRGPLRTGGYPDNPIYIPDIRRILYPSWDPTAVGSSKDNGHKIINIENRKNDKNKIYIMLLIRTNE